MPERHVPVHSRSKRRPPDTEGRAWVRYPCDSEISFQPLECRKDGNWRAAKIANISAKGIGLLLETPIETGAILCVLLEGSAQRLSQPLLARVVRATERSGVGWHVGCTFAIPLSNDELRALVSSSEALPAAPKPKDQTAVVKDRGRAANHDPFLQGSPNERRNSPRRRVSVPITISYGSAWESRHEAHAIDTSLGGLKLLTRQPFGRGTILRVRSTKTPARVPSVEVKVKSCTPQQSKWIVATQFQQRPPSEVLLYFS
jgi:hypothetical protein